MFLFDADKAANGGIFHELWAIVRNFAMTSGLRLAAAIAMKKAAPFKKSCPMCAALCAGLRAFCCMR